MCEESACLVPPLDHSNPSESRLSSTSGTSGAPTYNGDALVGFHEDALSQAAVGKAQLLLACVLGLALAADCSEVALLGYILPAAELHLCIDDHRKGWLISITLLAMAGGSLAWGTLADHLGRRRALTSALSVAALFSAVATVMPTYGTFMTARFCSGLGVAGAFPIAFSYLSETCSRATRTRYSGLLHAFWPLGAIFTSLLAHFTMPTTGAEIVDDEREHWSSWHRFLILSMLPTVGCIIGLIWASESPRYLLEASREVEALEVYQRLHRLNKTRTQYGLTELELPGRSAYRDHGLDSFRDAFQRISSPTHFRTTLLLAALHLLLGFVYTGVSTFSTSLLKEINDQTYYAHRTHVAGAIYKNHTFNATIDNTAFQSTLFANVTFRQLTLNHVEFADCVFDEAEFVNVKSSITYFENSTIRNSRLVDTDLTDHHFINCDLFNNTILSLVSDCALDFDYNVYLDDLYRSTMIWAGAMVGALLFMGFILETVARPPAIIVSMLLASLVAIGFFFLKNAFCVTVIELLLKVLIMCAVNAVTLVVVEEYPCYIRCTAHGMMRSLFHLASLCAIPIYGGLVHTILLFPAVITIFLTFLAALLATKVQDNSKILL